MMKTVIGFTLLLIFVASCQQEQKKNKSDSPQPSKTIPTPKADVQSASNEETEDPASTIDIIATETGKLEWLSTKVTVKKGASLYRIKNGVAFKDLLGSKFSFKRRLDSLITTCPENLSVVRKKWSKFYADMKPDSLVPVFPKLDYREEADHFGMQSFINDYNRIVVAEKKMKDYFGLAKKNLKEVVWMKKAGDNVKKGEVIGKATI